LYSEGSPSLERHDPRPNLIDNPKDAWERADNFCIMGALLTSAVHLGYELSSESWSYMTEDATKMMEIPKWATSWNNAVAQSKDEVLEALKVGALNAKEQIENGPTS